MGYSKIKHSGGIITNYQPDDSDNEFYIAVNASLAEIYDRALEKWPEINMDQIQIYSEYIQTECLYYDCYDSGDYTNFLRISKL